MLPVTPESPSPLFRREAIDHYLRESEGKDVLRVTRPWSWILLGAMGSFVMIAFLFSIFGKVEVNERGRGILRPAAGVRLLTVQNPGTVVEVLVPSGSAVKAGQPIMRMQSPQIASAVIEAEAALRARSAEFEPVAMGQLQLFSKQIEAARTRIHQLTGDIESQRRAVSRRATIVDANRTLHKQGIIGNIELQNSEEQHEMAQRALAAAEQVLRNAKADLVALEVQRKQQVWSHLSETKQAKARREGLDLSLQQTTLIAPIDGIVDGLVAKVGDQLSVGALAAKVVPKDSPLMVVAFLHEKDRAFVKEGDLVYLEFNQYPFAEFGTLQAKIARISSDLASPSELQESFGSATNMAPEFPGFRVELTLSGTQVGPLAKVQLRPGMLLQARFTLRRQSLITLAIEPLKRWLS